jgi:hypothetical protein
MHYTKPLLLIVDEIGYLPFEPDAAHLFVQLVSRRYDCGAMLATSNRAVGEWSSVRRGGGHGDPGSPALPLSCAHHPRRQLPPAGEASQRLVEGGRGIIPP